MNNSWRYAALAVLAAAAIGSLYLLRPITIPIFIAIIIAYLLDPAVDRLEKLRMDRSRSILLITALAVFLVILISLLVIPAAEKEIRTAVRVLPEHFESFKINILPVMDRLLGKILPDATLSVEGLMREGEAVAKKLPLDIWGYIFKTAAAAFKGTLSIIISIIGILIIPIYLYYILKDFDVLKRGIAALIPPRNRVFFLDKFREIDEVLSSFIRGQLIICLILAVLYTAGLYFIGIDLAIIIGILSGAAFIIPYAGAVMGVTAAAVMAILQFQDLRHVLYVFILYGGVQALEGTLLTPRIIGEKVGLHPLAIIISIIVGGELFGFLGILLAVPVAASLKVFVVSALEVYRDSVFYKANP